MCHPSYRGRESLFTAGTTEEGGRRTVGGGGGGMVAEKRRTYIIGHEGDSNLCFHHSPSQSKADGQQDQSGLTAAQCAASPGHLKTTSILQ